MPHTSHKKKAVRNKRQEIYDDDGWTRVTSNGPPRQPPPLPTPQTEQRTRKVLELSDGSTLDFGRVAEPSEHLKLESVIESFKTIERKWKMSESWESMAHTLQTQIFNPSFQIDTCVLFGSGSFTGLSQGWIDRSHVSKYQLALFLSVVDLMGKPLHATSRGMPFAKYLAEKHTGQRPMVAAQEPMYNSMDVEFLHALNIKVVEHPEGFTLLTNTSFAYCPGAEQYVTTETLKTDPHLFLGTKLDFYRGALGYLQSGVVSIAFPVWKGHEGQTFADAESLELDDIEKRLEEGVEEMATPITTKELLDGKNELILKGEKIDKDWVLRMRAKEEPRVDVIQHFLRNKDIAKVPDLDGQDFAVFGLHFAWRRQDPEE